MIEVKFTGEVVSNKVESFTSKSTGNEYTKREIVLTKTAENGYSDTLAVVCFGENAEKAADLKQGDVIEMRGTVNSREYNGRYFTQVNLWEWKIADAPKPVVEAPKVEKKEKPQEFAPQSQNDGLPF